MKYVLSTVWIALILLGCNPSPAAEETNNSNAEKEAAKTETQKIVSLNGTLTEILFALGKGDQVVGLDVTSTFPAEATDKLPKVGHVRNVQAEGILSLNPDVVYAIEGELNPQLQQQLKSAHVDVALFEQEYSPNGTYQLIEAMGTQLNKVKVAGKIVAEIESELNTLKTIESAPKVLFIYARGAGTLMVAGENTQMDAIIKLAGGQNAVSGFEDFQPLTPEALAAANPDYILMFSRGAASLTEDGGVSSIPGIAQTTAGKNNQIITMDGLKLSGFGPRLGEAAVELNQQFIVE